MYYLFYAGMANDKCSEQIGLALSRDGMCFHRVGADGLILPRGPEGSWTELRTCNPVVLREDGQFLMWYQGVSHSGYSIGRAASEDGVRWHADEHPCLTGSSFAEALQPDLHGCKGVIEPCVFRWRNMYRMYFMTYDTPAVGNRLHLAESADGVTWSLVAANLLCGRDFGDIQVFYPQVVASEVDTKMYLTLRRIEDLRTGMYRLSSRDGLTFGALQPVWPKNDNLRRLAPRKLASCLPIQRGRGLAGRAIKAVQALGGLIDPYPGGYAHTTFVEAEMDSGIYFHGYKTDKKGVRGGSVHMSIGLIKPGASSSMIREVFAPANDPLAWDAFFVADPFILKIDDERTP